MAVNDLSTNGFDADAARYERMNRTQPAEFAPGQDATFQQQDIFATSVTPTNPSAVSDIFSSTPSMGGDPFGTMSQGMGGMQGGFNDASGNSFAPQPMQAQQMPKSQEEMFYDACKAAGKGFFGFIKDFVAGISAVTPLYWQYFGLHTLVMGLCAVGGGLVGKIFGLADGLQICIGGCLSAGVGVLVMCLTTDSARQCTSQYKDENNTMQNFSEPSAVAPSPTDGIPAFNTSTFPTESFDSQLSDFQDDDSEVDDFDDYGDWGDGDDWGSYDDTPQAQGEEGMSTEAALASLPEIDKGMYTRQYLYDMFTKKLPTMKPDFARIKEIDPDDDTFLLWGERLRDAASVAGCKEDYLPELTRLQENLFTVIVTCDRPQGFKPDAVANELANIYAYKDGERNENVFAKVDTVGRDCIITIFNGAAAMISLKDMMLQVQDFILDSKNYIPVVLGTDQLGKVIHVDFKKLESIIITGMPRSGKSWFVQAVLTQMCAYVSPSELNIYICDPKEGISDFKAFQLPHVKKFVSGDNNIVQTLRNLVKVEAPRRKKIIGDAGYVNIWDYKEAYPDIKLPIIYVVIDEVVTLAERMEKEVKQEFQGLLIELISQLPALGIRAFLIPHVIKNDVIAKTATDLVPCKISVCGDADHIEKATGSKPKDFPYKLVNKGDMAVKLTGFQNTLYIHGPALTDSNPKNNEVFDYLRRVWTKLEGSEVAGSVADGVDAHLENQAILATLGDDVEEPLVFTNPNSEGLSGFEGFDD